MYHTKENILQERIKIAEEYFRRVTAWITKEQSDKIGRSNLSDSQYVREAIDDKDLTLDLVKLRMKNYIIDELIDELSDKKNENVRQKGGNLSEDMDEDVRQIYDEIQLVRQNEENLSDNEDENVRQSLEEIFGKHLQAIVNLIQFNGNLSPAQYKRYSKQMGITKKELKNLVDDNYEELLEKSAGRHYQ